MSLVIVLAAAGLWVRGQRHRDRLILNVSGDTVWHLVSVPNGVMWAELSGIPHADYETDWLTNDPGYELMRLNRFGFGAGQAHLDLDEAPARLLRVRVAQVPSYAIVAAASVPLSFPA